MTTAWALMMPSVMTSYLWANALLACPRVSVARGPTGTGVVIALRENVGWLLTAAHVAIDERVEVAFTSWQSYPEVAWYGRHARVVARWPQQDLALVRFETGGRKISVLPLAPPWARPKRFPATAWSIGLNAEGVATVQTERLEAREYVDDAGRHGVFFWRTTRAPSAGRSGGPLLDAQRRVIGIAVAARGSRGYYLHHDEILAALLTSDYKYLLSPR
jgi:S1-C subfamily serine protease